MLCQQKPILTDFINMHKDDLSCKCLLTGKIHRREKRAKYYPNYYSKALDVWESLPKSHVTYNSSKLNCTYRYAFLTIVVRSLRAFMRACLCTHVSQWRGIACMLMCSPPTIVGLLHVRNKGDDGQRTNCEINVCVLPVADQQRGHCAPGPELQRPITF